MSIRHDRETKNFSLEITSFLSFKTKRFITGLFDKHNILWAWNFARTKSQFTISYRTQDDCGCSGSVESLSFRTSKLAIFSSPFHYTSVGFSLWFYFYWHSPSHAVGWTSNYNNKTYPSLIQIQKWMKDRIVFETQTWPVSQSQTLTVLSWPPVYSIFAPSGSVIALTAWDAGKPWM